MCDNRKLFTDIYTGEPGSMHDARMYRKSALKHDMDLELVAFPHNSHILGDLAYPLSTKLLVGFKNNGYLTPRQINFNQHISQVRVKIENSFALLKGRFRRLKYIETIRLDLICLLINSACILHNISILNGDDPSDIMNVVEEQQEERHLNEQINVENAKVGGDRMAVNKRNNIMHALTINNRN